MVKGVIKMIILKKPNNKEKELVKFYFGETNNVVCR